MTRMYLFVFLLLAAAVSIPSTVTAEEEAPSYIQQYLTFGAGANIPTGEVASDSCLELSYGIMPRSNVAIEANLGYLQAHDFIIYNQRSYEFNTMIVSLTGTAKAFYPIGLGSLYALAGGGVYYAMLNNNGNHADAPFPTDDNDMTFGYYAGVGGELFVSHDLSFMLEAKWLDLHPSFDKMSNSVLNSLGDRDFSGVQILGKVSYSF